MIFTTSPYDLGYTSYEIAWTDNLFIKDYVWLIYVPHTGYFVEL